MARGLVPPGSVSVKNVSIAGLAIREHVHEIKIIESILRPYILVEIYLYDHHNWGNTLKLEGGEPITIAIGNGDGDYYDWSGFAVKQTKETAATGGRTTGSKITAACATYLANESSLVEGSWKMIPASSVIAQIHSQFLQGGGIYRMSPSMGMIGEKQPFTLNGERPFDAIAKIRRDSTSAAHPQTGAYAYYRDKIGWCLMPLEQLFAEAQPVATFVQDATVGASFLDMHRIRDNILQFSATTSFNGGSFNPAKIMKSMASQVTSSWSITEGKYNKGSPIDAARAAIGSSFPVSGAGFGSAIFGSQMHYIGHDKQRQENSTKQMKAAGEKLMGDQAQDGFGYTLQVLFDKGIHLTVGKGIFAKPVIPRGDNTGSFYAQPKRAGGLALVANLTHHIRNYDVKPMGTTTAECLQGGFSV